MPPSRHPNDLAELVRHRRAEAIQLLAVSGGGVGIDPGTGLDLATAAELQADVETLRVGILEIVIDGAGQPPVVGVKLDIPCNFAGIWTGWWLVADQAGSIQLDLWKDTYANFPPTVADTITAAAKPAIVTAAKNQDAGLTGWTTAFAAGDILRVNLDSVTTITRVTLGLKWKRNL